jgi:Tfp pilus assembly pilus retraction ATPase PilT
LAPFGQAVSEEKIFLTLANQKKELILATMFVGQTNGTTFALIIDYHL